MAMNLDDPNDFRELNTHVKNYVMAEFVAVPPNFDLKSHLSMREQVGMFAIKNMDIEKASIFVDTIKHSAVFSSLNNALIHPSICFFVLNLFQELGLILQAIDNPIRREMDKDAYMRYAKWWEQNRRHQHMRGQEVERISFLIVNVVHLFNDSVYKEAIEAMERVTKYQEEVNSMNFKLE
jgi:hypothetical protein